MSCIWENGMMQHREGKAKRQAYWQLSNGEGVDNQALPRAVPKDGTRGNGTSWIKGNSQYISGKMFP